MKLKTYKNYRTTKCWIIAEKTENVEKQNKEQMERL